MVVKIHCTAWMLDDAGQWHRETGGHHSGIVQLQAPGGVEGWMEIRFPKKTWHFVVEHRSKIMVIR